MQLLELFDSLVHVCGQGVVVEAILNLRRILES